LPEGYKRLGFFSGALINTASLHQRLLSLSILEYAARKDLAEIAQEEKSSRGTILRILRTATFTLLEIAGIIGPT
jgi:hypothetical protein